MSRMRSTGESLNKGFFGRRQHPVKILSYIAKYLWLLLIPLAKYLIAERFDLKSWFRSNWVEIITLSFILGYGFLRWLFVFFDIEEDCIVAHTGYFGIEETRVYFSEMSTLSLCSGYVYRAIGACTLYIDTDALSLSGADITLDITRRQGERIYELATKKCRNRPKYIFNSQKKNLLLFSLLFSSTLSGMLLTVTFIYEIYRIVGGETEREFLERVSQELEKYTSVVPKSLLVAAVIIAGGWLVSFLANLMRHWGFSCTRCEDMLLIKSGKGAKRQHILMRGRINSIDFQQSLLMKLFNICTVSVNCTGYGKRRLEISALVPITTGTQADNSIRMLLPGTVSPMLGLKTGLRELRRYIRLPLYTGILIWVGYFWLRDTLFDLEIIDRIIPDWRGNLMIFAVIFSAPFFWLAAVKAAAAMTSGVGFDKTHCFFCCAQGYRFHRVTLRRDKISKLVIVQNPIQKLFGTCHFKLYTASEKRSCYILRAVDYELVKSLLEREGISV